MTDELRSAFNDLLVGEPPLRTTADDSIAAGRRLRSRQRALWTSLGTAAAVAAVALVPQVIGPLGGPTNPAAEQTSPTASASATATPTAWYMLELQPFRVCPSAAPTDRATDGWMLPDPDRAAAAVLAAAPQIAPGLRFITRIARAEQGPKVALTFDVGDDAGYGEINLEITPESVAEPSDRALLGANVTSCVDGWRNDFADGSVAIYYPYGPGEQEAAVMHVWYFAAGGFTMNIGVFPRAGRGTMPLTISQVMAIADVVAHS